MGTPVDTCKQGYSRYWEMAVEEPTITGRSLSSAHSVSELSIGLPDISLSSLLQLMDAPVEFDSDSETDYDDDENSHVNEVDGHVNGGDEDRRINTTAWDVFRTRL